MLNYIRTQIDILRLPEDIRRWVRALRSGKYNQVRGTLEGVRGGFKGYCCLGVKAKIDNDNRLYPVELEEDRDLNPEDEGDDGIYKDLRDNLGNPFVDTLIDMNDDGKSFREISDVIITEYRDLVK